jgi:hypothetical protein
MEENQNDTKSVNSCEYNPYNYKDIGLWIILLFFVGFVASFVLIGF